MVLYSSTKFGILNLWSNIQSLRRFDSGLWQTSKQFIGNFNIERTFLESLKLCLAFPGKLFYICRPNLVFQSLEPIFYGPEYQNKVLSNSNIRRNFWRVQRFALFSQKNVFVFVNQISHSKVLNQYSMAQKIRFRLLTHFKTSL